MEIKIETTLKEFFETLKDDLIRRELYEKCIPIQNKIDQIESDVPIILNLDKKFIYNNIIPLLLDKIEDIVEFEEDE